MPQTARGRVAKIFRGTVIAPVVVGNDDHNNHYHDDDAVIVHIIITIAPTAITRFFALEPPSGRALSRPARRALAW